MALTNRLESGSRIAVITFHSLEDRIVKNFFRDRSREWLDRPGMARAAAQSRFFIAPHHAEAGRTRRDRAAGQPALPQRQAAGGGKDRMNRRRRKNFNPIDAPSLARWIVIIAFLAATGLSYVYLSVQLHHQGVAAPLARAGTDRHPDAKRRRQSAVRGPHFPHRTPAAPEGRLPQDDSDHGAEHR